MIKEDYVSFEVAKLLQEKGFNGEWHKHYWGYFTGKEFLTEGSFSPEYDCPAPTLQMAMKWLREVHNIEIAISYGIIFDHNTLKQVFRYFWSIVKVNGLCLEFPLNTPGDVCNKEIEANSYEETCEAAIKYCLENLI